MFNLQFRGVWRYFQMAKPAKNLRSADSRSLTSQHVESLFQKGFAYSIRI